MSESEHEEEADAAAPNFFARHAGDLRLSWAQPEGGLAFRSAQLGALFALAGHLQTSDEPAQAIVPTGVGKTAVICALPFHHQRSLGRIRGSERGRLRLEPLRQVQARLQRKLSKYRLVLDAGLVVSDRHDE
jgi:hypothetical protein